MTGYKRFLSFLLAVALVLCLVPAAVVAYAGESGVNVADNSSVSKQIDTAKWRVSGGVSSVNGKVKFDENCSETARITARSTFKDCSYGGVTSVFDSSYTLTVYSVPEGEDNRFAFASGLKRVANELGSDDTTEVYFVNDGSVLKIGVAKYADGVKTDVVAPAAMNGISFGTKFNLNVSLVAEGYLTVAVSPAGGDLIGICDDSTPGNIDHSLSGYIAIGQTAKCSAEISSVKISAYDYDNAETPLTLTETFDNNSYNGNAFYTRSDPNDTTNLDGGVRMENDTLKFIGRPSFISTMFSYSNFELTFDLVDVIRKDATDENGNVTAKKVSGWLGFSLDGDNPKGKFDNHARSNYLCTMEVVTREIKAYSRLSLMDFIQYPGAYKTDELDITNVNNEGKVYNYKVVMHDGVFSVWYKLSDVENYPSQPLYSANLGYTPYGSVAIMAYGDCGYTFDNLKIVNKDYAPKNVEIEYNAVSSRTEPDVKYEDKWSKDDLITNKIGKETTESGCGSTVSGLGASACALCLCLFAAAKRKKRYE